MMSKQFKSNPATGFEADAKCPNFKSWFRITFYAVCIGLGLAIVLSVLISVLEGKWIGERRASFQLLFSSVVAIFVSNSIHFSKRLWSGKGNHILYISLYYFFSLLGAFIAVELIYYIFAGLFNTRYTFFHKSDLLFTSIITVIISTVSYIHFSQKSRFSYRIKQKEMDLLRLEQMKTQAELATLQSKINPHFLYNALNAVASLIHLDPDKAENMTLKLSKLFRYSINQNQENLVSVAEELDILQTYLDIEKIRFGDRISFIVEADPMAMQEKIPRFLIQPLVENALKHGLKNTPANGFLSVQIRKKDMLEISVTDNGIPFPEELETGYGLQSTYDKLDLLFAGKYEIQILNHPVKQIIIQIPYYYA